MTASLLIQGKVAQWLVDETTGAALTQSPATALRFDVVDTTTSYLGKAAIGTLGSSGTWQVRRLTFTAGGGVTLEYADGDGNYDNIWDNRASLSYS